MYRAQVQQGTCTAYSSIATVTVNPATVGGNITGSTTVCSGSNSGTLVLTANTGNVVRWEYSSDNGSTWINISNSSSIQNFLDLNVSTLYRAVVQSGVCPQANSSTATINVDPVSVGGVVSGNTDVCYGSNNGSLSLSNYTGTIQKWEYSNDNGVNWYNINNSSASQNFSNLTLNTEYRALVKSGTCPADTSSFASITIDPLPVADAGSDTSVSLGYAVSLSGTGGTSYSWSPTAGLNDATVGDPLASPLATTVYTVIVTDANGCTATDQVTVRVNTDFNFTITNIITPNGDGKNDTWYIRNIDQYPACSIKIFDMDNRELFSASPYLNDWDGRYNGDPLPDGTYYYVMSCPGSEKEFKGYITLLRNK
jgi:gliding motility-associated-like protein